MIDLSKFTSEELELIEKLVDSKLKFEYEFNAGHLRGRDRTPYVREKKKIIESLTVLKAKIINLKTIDKSNK